MSRLHPFIRYCLLGIILFIPLLGAAQEKAPEIINQIDKDISFFYQNPQKATFIRLQKQFPIIEKYMANKPSRSTALPMIIWLDLVAKKHQWALDPTFKPKTIKQLNTPGSKLHQLAYGKGQLSPLKLDIWWSSFFATGDVAYVEKIYQQAKQLETINAQMEEGFKTQKKQDIFPFLVASAADWSFISNCQQHAVIRDFARNQLKNTVLENEKTLLEKCLADKK